MSTVTYYVAMGFERDEEGELVAEVSGTRSKRRVSAL